MSYFATQGALLESVTVAGQPGRGRDRCRTRPTRIHRRRRAARGTSRTVVLHLSERAATRAPIVLRQPLVRPLHVTLDDAVCS